jgi:hypothetical protein
MRTPNTISDAIENSSNPPAMRQVAGDRDIARHQADRIDHDHQSDQGCDEKFQQHGGFPNGHSTSRILRPVAGAPLPAINHKKRGSTGEIQTIPGAHCGAFHSWFAMVGPRVAGLNSTFSQPAAACGMTTGALGLRARAPNGLAVELEYGVSTGTGALLTQSIRGAVRMPF